MVKGKWFWKYRWYSICSKHRDYDKFCSMCCSGRWINVWSQQIARRIFSWKIRRWWNNRPNSKSRLFLESVFPNLKVQR